VDLGIVVDDHLDQLRCRPAMWPRSDLVGGDLSRHLAGGGEQDAWRGPMAGLMANIGVPGRNVMRVFGLDVLSAGPGESPDQNRCSGLEPARWPTSSIAS
jgi:hypothetical protein